MARTKYREKLQMIYAVQSTGSNLSELQDFAPGKITMQGGQVMLSTPVVSTPVNTTDWLIDDPMIAYVSVITNTMFQARFDPTPQGP
jgi:hypothetical protein